MSAAAVVTRELAKDYAGATALAPLDLEIPAGQRVALVGHNGSGKTTLIRMLTGMLDPSDGRAEIAGHPLGSIEARAALAYLAETSRCSTTTCRCGEHLEYVARLHGSTDWEQRATELLADEFSKTTDDSTKIEAEGPKIEVGDKPVDLDPSTDDDVDVDTPAPGDQ